MFVYFCCTKILGLYIWRRYSCPSFTSSWGYHFWHQL